jgi:hypothetical protein
MATNRPALRIRRANIYSSEPGALDGALDLCGLDADGEAVAERIYYRKGDAAQLAGAAREAVRKARALGCAIVMPDAQQLERRHLEPSDDSIEPVVARLLAMWADGVEIRCLPRWPRGVDG